jgi:AcrR family transcriptional regulator
MKGKQPNAERSRRTREALVQAGRELFSERGFAATATEEIVARAGVTRGALYHQFEDKRALFLAVFEAVERDLVARLARVVSGEARLARVVSGEHDAVRMLEIGCAAFLDACMEPEVRRIALIDAPSVVGWEKWREVDARYGLGLLRGVLEQAAVQGVLDAERLGELSHLLLGALSEAAMVVAHAGDDAQVREGVDQSLRWLIGRLTDPSTSGP